MQLKEFDITKYKAVAFDLDGTLLHVGEISSYAKRIIYQLYVRGVAVIIATGRSWPIIPDEIKQLSGVRYIISSSGACVTDVASGRVLLRSLIKRDIAMEAINYIERNDGVVNVIYSHETVYSLKALCRMRKQASKQQRKAFRSQFKSVSRFAWNTQRDIMITGNPVEKLDCIFTANGGKDTALRRLRKMQCIEPVAIGDKDIEITARGVSKATGLKTVCASHGIALDEIVAFGDSYNDMTMLKACGYAVAMGNADREIKDYAAYVTWDVAQDGAARAADELFELGESI